jgi:hypothetical protein
MYARFKLTPAQRAKAEQMVAEVAKYSDLEHFIDCGVYWVDAHASTNPNQYVGLTFDGYLEVEGDRCALLHDGGFAAARMIVGHHAVPVKYDTSDRRLRWDETLEVYMHRAPIEERWDYIQRNRWWMWGTLFPHLRPVVAALRRSEARANAQYETDMIRQARVILAREVA